MTPAMEEQPTVPAENPTAGSFDERWPTLYNPAIKPDRFISYLAEERAIGRPLVQRLFEKRTLLASTWNDIPVILIPYRSTENRIVAIQAATINGQPLTKDGATKCFFKGSVVGADGFFCFGTPLAMAKLVIFVEAPINALSAYVALDGSSRPIAYIALGASGFTSKTKKLIPFLKNVKDICAFFDKDLAGDEATIKLILALGRPINVVNWAEDAENGADVNQLLKDGQAQKIVEMVKDAIPTMPEDVREDFIKKRFPRGPFPYQVLPEKIAKSFQQLARACATSPTSLPGTAAAIFSSCIGRTVRISPKSSWKILTNVWVVDIRPSGDGKTPAPQKLCGPLYRAQNAANDQYALEMIRWNSLSKKDQERGLLMKQPTRPRGFYSTDTTIEGLYVDNSGHGGKVIIVAELSSIISGANQYKNRGNDREAWLCLYDGDPARIVRAGGVRTLDGTCISIFGGIQLTVWISSFASSEEGKLLQTDGTVFRFLPTFEGGGFIPLTRETWSDENRLAWEEPLERAMRWADSQEKCRVLNLDDEALTIFIEWRNELYQMMNDFPEAVRGFIPKLVGVALKFAGILYLMEVFSRDEEPGFSLNTADIQKGITVSEFYLGHIFDAMEALTKEDPTPPLEYTDQVKHLVKCLKRIQKNLYQDRLSLGFIMEDFNTDCPTGQILKDSRVVGALLRKCGLSITARPARFKNQAGVKCLVWDEKTDLLLEDCP